MSRVDYALASYQAPSFNPFQAKVSAGGKVSFCAEAITSEGALRQGITQPTAATAIDLPKEREAEIIAFLAGVAGFAGVMLVLPYPRRYFDAPFQSPEQEVIN